MSKAPKMFENLLGINPRQAVKEAKLHGDITVKILEIVNEINQKIDGIIIPKLEKLEKDLQKLYEIH